MKKRQRVAFGAAVFAGWLTLLFLCALIGVMLAACGGGDSGPDTPDETIQPPTCASAVCTK